MSKPKRNHLPRRWGAVTQQVSGGGDVKKSNSPVGRETRPRPSFKLSGRGVVVTQWASYNPYIFSPMGRGWWWSKGAGGSGDAYISLYITAFHFVSFYLLISHYISVDRIRFHWTSLYPSIHPSIYLPTYLPTYPILSLSYVYIHIYIYIIYHSICICISILTLFHPIKRMKVVWTSTDSRTFRQAQARNNIAHGLWSVGSVGDLVSGAHLRRCHSPPRSVSFWNHFPYIEKSKAKHASPSLKSYWACGFKWNQKNL